MSNKISNSVKYMQLPNVAKQVLTGLADFADDSGRAYPSITTLSYALCLTTRSVSNGLAKLRELGLITQTPGNGGNNIYIIHPENFKGEYKYPPYFKASPLNDVHPCTTFTPERDSTTIEPHSCDPRTSFIEPLNDVLTNHHMNHHITTNQPSVVTPTQKPTPKSKPHPKEKSDLEKLIQLGCSEQLAKDFIKHRRVKKSAITDTALNVMASQATKAGIPFAQAAEITIVKGWVSFNASWKWQDETTVAQYQVPTNSNAPEDNHVPVMTDYERDENGMPVFTPIDWSDVLAEVKGRAS